jgi:triphosphoribosyl-dephospho-CoA synthetase
MKTIEFGSGRRMTEEQARKHRELSRLIEECLSTSKIDRSAIEPLVERLIAFVEDDEAAMETRIKAARYATSVISSSSLGRTECLGFRGRLLDAVSKSGDKALWDAFNEFENAIAKKERDAKKQSHLDVSKS